MNQNLQDFLWSAAGPYFWGGMAMVATLGAVVLFIEMLVSSTWNALSVGRFMWLCAMIMAAYIPFNSGLLIWSMALFVTGATYMAILVRTNWCHRPGGFWARMRGILHDWAGWNTPEAKLRVR